MTPNERRAIAAKRRWTDPEYRARAQESYNLRRGFHVPDHLRGDFKILTRTKRIPVRDAGRMLGLI